MNYQIEYPPFGQTNLLIMLQIKHSFLVMIKVLSIRLYKVYILYSYYVYYSCSSYLFVFNLFLFFNIILITKFTFGSWVERLSKVYVSPKWMTSLVIKL